VLGLLRACLEGAEADRVLEVVADDAVLVQGIRAAAPIAETGVRHGEAQVDDVALGEVAGPLGDGEILIGVTQGAELEWPVAYHE